MKPIRLFAVLVLAFLVAVPAQAAKKVTKQEAAPPADANAQSLVEFFKGETAPSPQKLDFMIEGGYADIRTETSESSGRYFLAGQAISGVAQDIYRLDLTFKKKYQRDVIDLTPEYFFTQQRSYYFWYNGGNRIVFKIGGGKKEFKFPKKELTEIKVKSLETYTIEKTKLPFDMKLSDGNTQIFIQLKFI